MEEFPDSFLSPELLSGEDGLSARNLDELRPGKERPLIPDGIYEAQCIKAKMAEVGVLTTKGTSARTPKAVLTFRITQGEHKGFEIPMFLNANYHRIPFGSKLYQYWVIANDGKRPNRKDRLSLRVFEGHIFEIKVTTVKGRMGDNREKPPALWYSRVDEVLEKLA